MEASPQKDWLKKFEELAANAAETHTLVGDVLIVQAIKLPEQKTASGILIGVKAGRQTGGLADGRAHFAKVLAVGKGYFDEADSDKPIPLDTKPGDIVLLSELSVKWLSSFGDLNGYEPDTIGLARESDVQLRFNGAEGWSSAFGILNKTIEEAVEPAKES